MGSEGVLGNTCLICAPIMAESVEQTLRDMNKAKEEGADVAEVRLDCIEDLPIQKALEIILKNKPLPVVIVNRPKRNDGQNENDELRRLEELRLAKELGADYVDYELEVASELTKVQNSNPCSGTKFIVSHHVNSSYPSEEELNNLVLRMQATGADIIKLVIQATDITELARTFHLISHCKVPVTAYSTGERGLISQLLCPKYGGAFVYGSIEGNTIPGMPTLESLKMAYEPKLVNADTKVFGLISKPVGHSKGPILHNPTFRHVNFNGIYVPMFVDNLKAFFDVYSSADFAGFSVGFPYKEAVVEFCDELQPLAQNIGAVNTIIRRPGDGKLIGYNTDCEAAVSAIEDAIKERRGGNNGHGSFDSLLTGRQFIVVGAGGAGRAVAFGAKTRGARVVIFDIDFARAKSLAFAVSGEARPFDEVATLRPEKGAILANATPLGMHPNNDRIPVAEATLGDYEVVFDAVYTPRKTRLLKDAEAAGTITVSGVEMFLRQAAMQFSLFTGSEAPIEFMQEIVLSKF